MWTYVHSHCQKICCFQSLQKPKPLLCLNLGCPQKCWLIMTHLQTHPYLVGYTGHPHTIPMNNPHTIGQHQIFRWLNWWKISWKITPFFRSSSQKIPIFPKKIPRNHQGTWHGLAKADPRGGGPVHHGARRLEACSTCGLGPILGFFYEKIYEFVSWDVVPYSYS